MGGITQHDVAGKPNYYLVRQALFALVGSIGFLAALAIDPDRLRRFWRPLYIGTVAVMFFVFLAGPVTRGSRRCIALAGFIADRSRRVNEPRMTLTTIGLAAVPIGLVFIQPDFGTALVYGAAL